MHISQGTPSGASLRGVYLAGCDLTGADLRGRS
ncbi:pentapeptide repeat-containing protein [Streptomyces sp. NBC_01717]|nr:pentapeptide repeat-containing protein [Streptomyces sp. NBC_01717]